MNNYTENDMIMTANSKNQPFLEMSLHEAIELQAKLASMIAKSVAGTLVVETIAVAYESSPGKFKPSAMHISVAE